MHLRSNRPALPAVLRAILCTGLCITALSAAAQGSGSASAAIDVNEIVDDHSQVEWSESYLQWIASFARGSSPISDATGALCAAKQDGDVWFLATSDGTSPVERSCAIPAGKTLFVPIANTLERSGNREPVCDTMVRIASGNLEHVTRMAMTVDAQAVDNLAGHRVATGGCFALGTRQVPRLNAKTAVADGYYVMLAPLSPGPHTIVVNAQVDSTPISTTYRLDVH